MYKKIIIIGSLILGCSVLFGSNWQDFLKAVNENDLAKMKAILEQDPDLLRKDWSTRQDALSIAVEKGNYDLVDFLISQGADKAIDFYNNSNNIFDSPMRRAIQKSNLDMIKHLLSYQKDQKVRKKNIQGILFLAVELRQSTIVRYALQEGANPAIQNYYGQTALVSAAFTDDLETVKLLLEYNADVNQESVGNTTPLIEACTANEKGNFEMVKLLVEKGADVNHSAMYGVTPLQMAAEIGSLEMVQYLVSKGGRVNDKDSSQTTPIMHAFCKKHVEVWKYLYEKGAKISVRDEFGNSLLILAVMSCQLEAVTFLVSHGANINDVANDGKTALIWGVNYAQTDIVAYLVSQGADVNIKDNEGKTAIDYAKTVEIKDILQKKMRELNEKK